MTFLERNLDFFFGRKSTLLHAKFWVLPPEKKSAQNFRQILTYFCQRFVLEYGVQNPENTKTKKCTRKKKCQKMAIFDNSWKWHKTIGFCVFFKKGSVRIRYQSACFQNYMTCFFGKLPLFFSGFFFAILRSENWISKILARFLEVPTARLCRRGGSVFTTHPTLQKRDCMHGQFSCWHFEKQW